MHARSERVSAARHEQRPQVQERGLVKRLREQIRNLFFGGHPVDRDHQVEIEFTAVRSQIS